MIDGEAISRETLWDEYYEALHEAYREMRRAFKRRVGLSQEDLADRLDINKGLISKRLNGEENLTLKTLSFMATAMDCRLSISYVPFEDLGNDNFFGDDDDALAPAESLPVRVHVTTNYESVDPKWAIKPNE